MAAFSTTKNETEELRVNKNENSIINIIKSSNDSFGITIFDLAVLVLSVFSIVSDLCTDLILVIQYSNQGYKAWAIGTFVLIFFPSLIVQFFSLRWHISDKTATPSHWVLHFFMLGIVHRYIQLIKTAFAAFKSKNFSDIQKLYLDQSDLCMLHLFESFLESAPQLVLQMYVIAMLHEWRFWTVLSALASLLSLAWALAAYTKAQRRARPNKNMSSWPGLVLQAIWRAGMLTSRISTLVLGAYCFGNYIFIIIMLHWVAMTIWIIYQKTDFCETVWEERIYNAVVGVIYCFCFFNLQEGQSRWRALAFYLIIVFQNLTCLTIFLMKFADRTPKLAISGFIAVVGGSVIGAASMLVYYRFFHPSGPIKLFFPTDNIHDQTSITPYSTLTLRSLKRMRAETPGDASQKSTPQSDSKQPLSPQNYLSDSVVIIEENSLDDTDPDIKALQNWINDDSNVKSSKTACEKNSSGNQEKQGDAYKRRAICSSVDLVKLLESKTESETESLKLAGTDESSSEILSAHDYENLAAVNIAREFLGLRSWKGYSDIETWLHDDSVVNERQLDTLTSTTSSDRSVNTMQKDERTRQDDYIDAIAEHLAHCDSEAGSDDVGLYSVEYFPVVYPFGTLDPIYEETEESSTSTEFNDLKIRNGSVSTLVATIDEIRLSTPTQNHYLRDRGYDGGSPTEVVKVKSSQPNWKKVTFASKLQINCDDSVETQCENKNQGTVVPVPFIQLKTACLSSPEKKQEPKELKSSNLEDNKDTFKKESKGNESISTVANTINQWNKILSTQSEKRKIDKQKITPAKKGNVKEKAGLFFMKVLSPPNFSNFQRNKDS